MTGEEMERAIEFLLKSQAAFDARHAAFAVEQEKTTQQIRELAARQDRTQEQLDHLSKVVASIAEVTQRNSDEIDALVKLTSGIIERGNGKPEN
jgi:ubiquinone biosynthesis protein COQ9